MNIYKLETVNLAVGEKAIKIWVYAFTDSTVVISTIKNSGNGLKKLKTSFGELKVDETTGKAVLSVEWSNDQYALDELESAVLSLEAVTADITVADADYTGSAV